MKAGRFASEYDKVRQRAGLAKPQYDFPDDAAEEVARRATAERVAALNDDFKQRMAERVAIEQQQAAERTAAADKNRREWLQRKIMAEYTDLGLEPPVPLVSMALMLSIGWKLERIGDRWELIRPPAMHRKKEEQF